MIHTISEIRKEPKMEKLQYKNFQNFIICINTQGENYQPEEPDLKAIEIRDHSRTRKKYPSTNF